MSNKFTLGALEAEKIPKRKRRQFDGHPVYANNEWGLVTYGPSVWLYSIGILLSNIVNSVQQKLEFVLSLAINDTP